MEFGVDPNNILDMGFYYFYSVFSSLCDVFFDLAGILLSYSLVDVLCKFLEPVFGKVLVDTLTALCDNFFAAFLLEQPIALWILNVGCYLVVLFTIFKWLLDLWKAFKSLIPFMN